MSSISRDNNVRGFTIVELLIVIVVIGILAAITIVAYNGVQQRARDATRRSDIASIRKALEMFHADNSGYPNCAGGVYRAGDARGTCYSDNAVFINALSPKYIASTPKDPLNSGDNRYLYLYGSKKISDTNYSANADDNYALIVSYESLGGPYVTQFGTKYNYIFGSNN